MKKLRDIVLMAVLIHLVSMHGAMAQWEAIDLRFTPINSIKSIFSDPYAGDLIIVGTFSTIDSTQQFNCAARWDSEQVSTISGISNLSTGCMGQNIIDVTAYAGKIFFGGHFEYGLEESPYIHLAIWDSSGTWETPPPCRLNNNIRALTIVDSLLYAAVNTMGAGLNPTCFYTFDGAIWDSISIVLPSVGVGGTFNAGMIRYGDRYFVGGNFSNSEGYDFFEWLGGDEFIPAWPGQSGSGFITDMVVYQGELVVAGYFAEAWGNPGNCIAAFDGTFWRPLYNTTGPSSNISFPSISDLLVHDGILYAFGHFTHFDGEETNGAAWWDGQEWTGFGVPELFSITSATIHQDSLYVAGGISSNPGWTKPLAKYVGVLPSNVNTVVEDGRKHMFSISPNPSPGILKLSMEGIAPGPATLHLLDMQGRTVLEQRLPQGGTATLQLGHLPAGLYMGRVAAGQEVWRFKWVRE